MNELSGMSSCFHVLSFHSCGEVFGPDFRGTSLSWNNWLLGLCLHIQRSLLELNVEINCSCADYE